MIAILLSRNPSLHPLLRMWMMWAKFLGVAPISDDGSVDSSLFSCTSESEGDIWGNNNYDDDASNAHEGANLVPPNFDGNEGVQPTPNITQAPEGAHRRRKQKSIHQPCGVVVLMAKWNAYH